MNSSNSTLNFYTKIWTTHYSHNWICTLLESIVHVSKIFYENGLETMRNNYQFSILKFCSVWHYELQRILAFPMYLSSIYFICTAWATFWKNCFSGTVVWKSFLVLLLRQEYDFESQSRQIMFNSFIISMKQKNSQPSEEGTWECFQS